MQLAKYNVRLPVIKNVYTNEVLRCIFNYLSREKLLEWSGWSSRAKLFINNGDVNLLESIQEHGKMIGEAYRVLINISSQIHGDDINVVNELIHRRNDILSGKIKI